MAFLNCAKRAALITAAGLLLAPAHAFAAGGMPSDVENAIKQANEATLKKAKYYAYFNYNGGCYAIKEQDYEDFIKSVSDVAMREEYYSPSAIETGETETVSVEVKDPRCCDFWDNYAFEAWKEEARADDPDWYDGALQTWKDWELYLECECGGYDRETGEMVDGRNVIKKETSPIYKATEDAIAISIRYDVDSISQKQENFMLEAKDAASFRELLIKCDEKETIESEEFVNPKLYQKDALVVEAAMNADGSTVRWNIDNAEVAHNVRSYLFDEDLKLRLNMGDNLRPSYEFSQSESLTDDSIYLVRLTYMGELGQLIDEVYYTTNKSFMTLVSVLAGYNFKNLDKNAVQNIAPIEDFFDTAVG